MGERRLTGRAVPAGFLALALMLPAAAQAPDQAVSLAFKHQVGKIRKYRLNSKADLVMTPSGMGGGGLGPIPLTLKTDMHFTEKVAGVRDGKATLSVTPLLLIADTGVMGMNMQMKMENGKVTMNGQPVPDQGGLGPMAAMLSNKPITVRRTVLGQIETDGQPNASLGQLLGSSFLIQLPERPVKVGDTWETAVKLPGAPGGAVPIAAAPIEVKFTHTLKALEMVNGRLQAVIESAGTAPAAPSAAPPAPAPPPAQPPGEGAPAPPMVAPSGGTSYAGTTRFDIEGGSIVGGKYTSDIRVTMPLGGLLGGGGGAPPPAGALPDGILIEGAMSFDLGEVPYTPPAPVVRKPAPPAKKPAPRPAPKRR
jgi:hypothetical protein